MDAEAPTAIEVDLEEALPVAETAEEAAILEQIESERAAFAVGGDSARNRIIAENLRFLNAAFRNLRSKRRAVLSP